MKPDSKIKRVNQKRVKVLGVGIDDVSKDEALKIVENWLCHPEFISGSPANAGINTRTSRETLKQVQGDAGMTVPKLIFTPGPEFLITAQKDPDFQKILNNADLNIPDGYGLKIFGGITNVIPGVEFMLVLCKMAAENGYTIGLLGGQTRVTTLTAEKLKMMFPGIKISFTVDGKDADRVIEGYDALRYVDILFVALGHPRQEKFLEAVSGKQLAVSSFKKNLSSRYPLTSKCFRVGMGVGGSFDLISGKISRAPEILQNLGLEWFWRLLQEPKRFKRIFTATIVFPFRIFVHAHLKSSL